MSPQLAWIILLGCLGVIWFAGKSLTRAADIIAVRTGIGRVFIGSVLLAAMTSLPEVATEAAAASMGLVDIALGDLFGSNIYNVTILAVGGIVWGRGSLLAVASQSHLVTALLGMLLAAIAALALLIKPNIGFLGIGIEIYAILGVYLAGVIMLRTRSDPPEHIEALPQQNLALTWVRFFISAGFVIGAAIFLSKAADVIATETGLGGTFIGTTLVAFTTSAPELVTSIAAIRMGAVDLALGNVLGSNIFNMNILVISDLFYRGGYIISAGSSTHAITALVGLLLSGLIALGLLSPIPGRIGRVSFESLIILAVYLLGVYLVFMHR
ncbi:MAG: sodium:calcium antiporter [Candidatus Bipolaricaulota bacterium]|nr:sodium:calcium antiporter [Candidatus Bipolaricaulota bacterium]MDW8031720.1 sodium:calcium antiporter [Candidatus Bipolaricaulota bacterium]